MSQNPIHEPGVGDDRDDLHLGAARAQQRIHLEGAFFILHLLQ